MIVEVNEHMPKIRGGYDECIHISDVDMIIEEHEPFADVKTQAPRRLTGR